MSGVPTSTSSRRAGKGFSRPDQAPSQDSKALGHADFPVRGSRGCWTRVGWSPPGVFSSGVKSAPLVPIHAAGTDKVHKRHAQKHEPQSHAASSAARPLVASPARSHTLHSHTRTRRLSPVTPSTHCKVTVAKSRAHDHDPRPPADRNADLWRLPGPGSAAVAADRTLSSGITDSVRAPAPLPKWASPHSTKAWATSPNRDAGI